MRFVLVSYVLMLASCANSGTERMYLTDFDGNNKVYMTAPAYTPGHASTYEPNDSPGYDGGSQVNYLELIRLGGQMMQGPRATTTNCIQTFTGMTCTSQ